MYNCFHFLDEKGYIYIDNNQCGRKVYLAKKKKN